MDKQIVALVAQHNADGYYRTAVYYANRGPYLHDIKRAIHAQERAAHHYRIARVALEVE